MPKSTRPRRPRGLRIRAQRWLNTWQQLDWRDQMLTLEALVLLGIARATVLLIPFKRVAPHLGRAQQETAHGNQDSDTRAIANRVATAIRLVSRHTPWQSNCFAQALAGHVMLRRRHAANTLYLGVYKNAHEFAAHAWIRHGDLIVTGGPGHERYTAIAHYGWQPSATA